MKYILVTLLLITYSFADIIYVGPAESYTTIQAGIGAMSGGDSLIVRNGTYTGASNRIEGVPSGNSRDDMTYILAETDYGVLIDLNQAAGYSAIYLGNDDYVYIRGFRVTNSEYTLVFSYQSDYCIFKRIFAWETGGNNTFNFGANQSKYNLFEECAAWGWGRYSFMADGSTWDSLYVIFRRCVARNDNIGNDISEDARQTAAFGAYQEQFIFFQNCIAIDGVEIPNPYSTMIWMTPNGAHHVYWDDCIQVNNKGALWYMEGTTIPHDLYITNSLFLGNEQTINGGRATGINSTQTGALKVRNCSFFDQDSSVAIFRGAGGSEDIVYWNRNVFYLDTLISDENTNSLLDNTTVDSAVAFSNSAPDGTWDSYVNANGTNLHDGSPSSYDPATNYTYPPLRDDGEGLDNDNYGAHIEFQRGVSGTLYGEAGWDSLTSDPLWPFPQQDSIRKYMRQYDNHGMDGARGFCAEGEDLTNYIMNWFGNGNPYAEDAETFDSTFSYINSDEWTFNQDFVISDTRGVGSFCCGIKLYDMTDPAIPVELEQLFIGEPVYGLDIQSDTVYAASDSFIYKISISGDGFSVLDSVAMLTGRDVKVRHDTVWTLSSSALTSRNKSDLNQISTTANGGNALTLDAGNYIYVSRGSDGLDIRNANTLALEANIPDTDGNVRKSVISGDSLIYIDGLKVHRADVSNPSSPVKEDSLTFTNGTRWIVINNTLDTVYVICHEDGVIALDVATLTNLGEVAADNYTFYRGSYKDGLVYCGAFSQAAMGFHIWDVLNPAAITRDGLIESNDYVRGLAVYGDSLYVVDGHYGIACYDISYNDFAFRWRTQINTAPDFTSPWNVAVSGNHVVMPNVDGYLHLLNKSGTTLDSINISVYDVEFVDDTLYAACAGDDGIRKYSTNGNEFTLLDSQPIGDICSSIAILNDTIYVANVDTVFSFTSQLNAIDTLVLNDASYISVDSNYLFISASPTVDSLYRYNHSFVQDTSIYCTEVRQIYSNGTYVYASREENGMTAYDSDLNVVETVTSPFEVYYVIENSGLIYLAERSNVRWMNHTGTTPGTRATASSNNAVMSAGGSGNLRSGGSGEMK